MVCAQKADPVPLVTGSLGLLLPPSKRTLASHTQNKPISPEPLTKWMSGAPTLASIQATAHWDMSCISVLLMTASDMYICCEGTSDRSSVSSSPATDTQGLFLRKSDVPTVVSELAGVKGQGQRGRRNAIFRVRHSYNPPRLSQRVEWQAYGMPWVDNSSSSAQARDRCVALSCLLAPCAV